MQTDPRKDLILCLMLAVVYGGGLFVPLMNNDSGHHAGIALHMFLSGDYASLITQGEPYLDKPHLLFWLVSASYHLFGVTTFAFKFPSLLFSMLAVYATYRLARLLYSAEAGRIAAMVLASSLAFVLANNDVRMDAVLTASIALAIWQLAEYAHGRRWANLILASLGLALGFATKGMIGVAMPAIAIFLHLLYRREWRVLFDPRWLVLILLTVAFASPVLWAYHSQFGMEGVKFILWSQNFERLAGARFGNAGSDDPLFFVHTYLWAFLPWSLLGAAAIWSSLRKTLAARLRPLAGQEMLTLGTIVVMFGIISASGFKLPHYLNILLPLLSVQLGAWLAARQEGGDGRGLRYAQYAACGLMALLAAGIHGWAFPIGEAGVWLGLVVLAVLGALRVRASAGKERLLAASVVCAVLFNFLQNFNFYPQLLEYQAGNRLAAAARSQGLDLSAIRFLQGHGRANSFDFYIGRLTPPIDIGALRSPDAATLIYTSQPGLAAIRAAGLSVEVLAENVDFRVTRLNVNFLDPQRRAQTLGHHYLLRVAGER